MNQNFIDINCEIEKLKNSRFIRNDEEFKNFEQAIINLSSVNDCRVIKKLCEVFEDDTECEDVMFGLVHLIESFRGENAIKEFIEAVPSMLSHAKEWVNIIHYRILNNDFSRKEYINALKKVDIQTKQVIIKVLEDISKEDSEKFKTHVDEILLNT